MKAEHIVAFIFITTLLVRLVIAFSIPTFTHDSYFHLRQVEHIGTSWLPLYEDPLSYGGRDLVFLPLFHYLMAFFDLFLPLAIVAKIVPNLLLATLTILVYLIGRTITNREEGPLLSSFIAGFLPIIFTPNSFTPVALFLPLLLLAIYSFLRLAARPFLIVFIASFLLLSLTSSATFLLIIGFGIYLLLSLVERKRVPSAEREVIIFSVFFFLWMQFLFFKDTFLQEGISFFWQNIPPQVIAEYFPSLSLSSALLQVSIIPFIAGIGIVYKSLFKAKNQAVFLLISFAISTMLLAWLRLIRFKLSLAFFGLILAILFALFYDSFFAYLSKTKLQLQRKHFTIILILLLSATMLPPTLSTALRQDVPHERDIALFTWLEGNTPPTAGVVAPLEEGHLVTYYAKRRNLIDEQFNLIPDAEDRFKAMRSLYSTSFQTQAIELLEKYRMEYIVLSSRTRERYVRDLPYYSKECFEPIRKEENRKVYYVECILQEE